MDHKNIHEITNIYESTVKMVRFRLNKGWDYVWITYDEERGFITMSSSYGDYSCIWSAIGEGVKLSEFFVTANKGYLVDNFFTGKESTYFDLDQAKADIKQDVIQGRRDGTIDKEDARAVFDFIRDELNYNMSSEEFSNIMFDSEAINNWNQDWWDGSIGMKRKGRYITLRDEIIPMIQKYFKGEFK